MSKAKFEKYLNKPLILNRPLRKQPILLSDSKGNYLKPYTEYIEQYGYTIDLACKKGARFCDSYFWLERNLARKVQNYNQVVLFVLLGTCDLTVRKGKYIQLRHSSDSIAVSYLQSQIDRYIRFVSEFSSVTLIFLDIVPYSIKEWNKSRGHSDPDLFLQQDLELYERICLVNDYIRHVNYCAGVKSPNLKSDLIRYRKAKLNKGYRVSVSFSYYLDGIHPGPLLACCWMKRIIACSFMHCI